MIKFFRGTNPIPFLFAGALMSNIITEELTAAKLRSVVNLPRRYSWYLPTETMLEIRGFMVEGEPLLYVLCMFGFPCGASDKEPACQCRRCKRCTFDPWVEKIPWRRKWQPTPVFLPGKSHGQRSLVGSSPQGFTERDTTEATSSTVFAEQPITYAWLLRGHRLGILLIHTRETHVVSTSFHV